MPPKAKSSTSAKGEGNNSAKLAQLQDKVNVLSEQNQQLGAEVKLAETHLASRGKAVQALQDQLTAAVQQLEATKKDFDGLASHQVHESKRLEEQITRLEIELLEVKEHWENETDKATALKHAKEKLEFHLSLAEQQVHERFQVEERLAQQEAANSRQEAELMQLRQAVETQNASLKDANQLIEELELKSAGTMRIAVVFNDAWLLQVNRCKLQGKLPAVTLASALTYIGGKLVLTGGRPVGGAAGGPTGGPGGAPGALTPETHCLHLTACQWQASAATVLHTDRVKEHAAAPMGHVRVLLSGGTKSAEGCHGNMAVVNTETMKTVVPSLAGSSGLPLRWGHSMVTVRDRVYLFGGMTRLGGAEQGPLALCNDVWEFNGDTMRWKQIEVDAQASRLPRARCHAAMAGDSEDNCLWVFGGRGDDGSLNDLWCFHLATARWSIIPTKGIQPGNRENACLSVLDDRHLLLMGGLRKDGPRKDSHKQLYDLLVLDTRDNEWGLLDDGTWANGLVWAQPGTIKFALHGHHVYIVKPNRDQEYDELQVVQITSGQQIAKLKEEKRDKVRYDRLEILEDQVLLTPSTIDLVWRPPTKNVERIQSYKVMLSSTLGAVRTVYDGLATTCKVTGLMFGTEYVFCVKASYTDGSIAWSESRVFRTLDHKKTLAHNAAGQPVYINTRNPSLFNLLEQLAPASKEASRAASARMANGSRAVSGHAPPSRPGSRPVGSPMSPAQRALLKVGSSRMADGSVANSNRNWQHGLRNASHSSTPMAVLDLAQVAR